ncbi:hypothetical protein QLG07_11220 [Erwinia sp. V90_4]|uniref:hypothetical protein n=1 Tax=Erwinia TaxID=551 RepID=UPI00249E4690|nr:hypothetical protein [Erwinia sp. V90_4]MDI3440031.1 hypothetical protein [Erwinia sp. V90_4]
MFKRIVKWLTANLIISLSGLLLFSSLGYYLFWFDWNVSALDNFIHTVIFVLLITVSVIAYAIGEKLRLKD